MIHQLGFIIRVGSSGLPIERSRDHLAFIYHGEVVVELVVTGEAGSGRRLVVAVFFKESLKDAHDSPYSISGTQARRALDLLMRRPRATKGYWVDGSGLAFKGVSPKPKSHAKERDVRG